MLVESAVESAELDMIDIGGKGCSGRLEAWRRSQEAASVVIA